MTNHKAIADHLALGSSPAQVAAALGATLTDVDHCVAALQTILRATTLDDIRDRLIQMGYGTTPLAPWTAEAFATRVPDPTIAPAA